MDWGTIAGTVTGALIGVGATSLADRSRWRREQATRQTAIKRELYAAYLAAVAQSWNEIRAAVIDSDDTWPERARLASLAYRNGGVYKLRYQISITAPPNLVALSDQTMRGIRDLINRLNSGQAYGSWDELKRDNQAWFDAFNNMRRMMRLDLDPEALHLPPSSP
ncbi:hypothetical protein ACWIGF_28265 [Streptomyces diastaticus]|uniref:hypothetical protein n=1 Tax=Streptomyces sp. DSM 41037 TaxID=2817710 RepID=UPI002784A899|nr:hypothetical protein [Streptomyces sp. DSM 41037]MDQ0297478.1 hypothetical protein [Streptomyces sp. DSM 41037]